MTPILLLWTVAAGSFLTMAGIELVVAAMQRETRPHLAFGVVALAAMAGVLTEAVAFGTTSPTAMTPLIKIAVTCNIAAHIGLIVFLLQYAGARFRWPGWQLQRRIGQAARSPAARDGL